METQSKKEPRGIGYIRHKLAGFRITRPSGSPNAPKFQQCSCGALAKRIRKAGNMAYYRCRKCGGETIISLK